MRHGVLAFLLVLLVPAALLAAQVVTLGDGEPVEVRVLESTDARTVLEFEVSSFVKTPVEIDGKTFYSLVLGEEGITLDAGYPELPNVARSIVIPDDAAMAYRVVDSHFVEYDGVPVVPSKGNLSRQVDPASVPYEFGAAYGENAWYPADILTARDPYIMRDVRGQAIVLRPFQVNPATGALRVYDRVVVEAVPTGPARMNELTHRPAKLNAEFVEIYKDHFLNYDAVSERYPDVADVGNMLVICYGDFMTSMEPFVEWKNQMGVPCEMVSVTDAGGTASGIDTYVQNYYDTNGLTYLLLVGDAAQVPSLTVSSLSDPSYSLTAGTDNYGDLFVGRFSAETVAQVETQVLRSVEYEKRPLGGGAWYHKGTGVASNQGTGDDGEYDDEHQDNIRDLLMAFTYTEVDQIYDPTGTAAMVSTALNDGRSTVNYTGHGSTTSWGSTGFSNTDINNLVNDNMLPFITSVACVNGAFGSTTCFAEAWLRATNGSEPTGAVGIYASTVNQSWSPPMEGQDEFIDLLVGEAKRSFAALCFQGSSSMIDVYGTDGEDEFLHWTIFGDPSLKVRTDTPTDVTVNHLDVMFPSMTTFDVEVVGVEGALCSIYGNGVNYGTATTDATGNATINLTAVPPVGETLTLTVTGFNLMTYTADMLVIVPVTYTIDPPSVPINTATDVTVTVLDSLSNPVENCYIEIDGWGVSPISGTTGPSGDV
ncbi:MAG: hypothetical protein GF405_10605, partial [Candidatus Eisenbacteria bacterium]|nr:hypothetical protein [Candidatus Eisenbacteria bacterium]